MKMRKNDIMPSLNAIDHVHIYVRDRAVAKKWYAEVLGFTPVQAFLFWAENNGPLTLENSGGSIHLALFEREGFQPGSTVAFGVSAKEFMKWRTHLEAKGLSIRVSDHDKAFSLYFSDPDKNLYEIISYEAEFIRANSK